MCDYYLSQFEKLSYLFNKRFIVPGWKKFPYAQTDALQSVCFFLHGYGFEHQGRSASYAPAAIDAINEARKDQELDTFAEDVWQHFTKKIDKPNKNNNPLYNDGNAPSIIVFLKHVVNEPLVVWAKQNIESDQVKHCHQTLTRIRGIGNKISSLFLRDLATHFSLTPSNCRYLLQPVDIWVRLVVQSFSGNNQLSDERIEKSIVDFCKDYNPEKVNQGIWYFCTQVCLSTNYIVKDCLANKKLSQQYIQDHLEILISDGISAKSLI